MSPEDIRSMLKEEWYSSINILSSLECSRNLGQSNLSCTKEHLEHFDNNILALKRRIKYLKKLIDVKIGP